MSDPQVSEMNPTRDEFAALLEESFGTSELREGSVVPGTVIAIEKDLAVIDVGLKTEGRIPLKEFVVPGRDRGARRWRHRRSLSGARGKRAR